MCRVILIHWKAEEIPSRLDRLRRLGFKAEPLPGEGAAGLRALRQQPPDAVLIDLGRLPAQGLAAATMLRQQKATRCTPIVFIGGAREKIERTRRMLPDAIFTDWPKIRLAVRKALANPVSNPRVPSTMEPYAGVPLVKKLGIKPGQRVILLNAPPKFERRLGRLVEEITICRQLRGKADTILMFLNSQAELRKKLPAAIRCMAGGASLWMAWPKRTSGVESDLSQAVVRQTGLDANIVDYKIAAIDEVWSGLRFAARQKVRSGR